MKRKKNEKVELLDSAIAILYAARTTTFEGALNRKTAELLLQVTHICEWHIKRGLMAGAMTRGIRLREDIPLYKKAMADLVRMGYAILPSLEIREFHSGIDDRFVAVTFGLDIRSQGIVDAAERCLLAHPEVVEMFAKYHDTLIAKLVEEDKLPASTLPTQLPLAA